MSSLKYQNTTLEFRFTTHTHLKSNTHFYLDVHKLWKEPKMNKMRQSKHQSNRGYTARSGSHYKVSVTKDKPLKHIENVTALIFKYLILFMRTSFNSECKATKKKPTFYYLITFWYTVLSDLGQVRFCVMCPFKLPHVGAVFTATKPMMQILKVFVGDLTVVFKWPFVD